MPVASSFLSSFLALVRPFPSPSFSLARVLAHFVGSSMKNASRSIQDELRRSEQKHDAQTAYKKEIEREMLVFSGVSRRGGLREHGEEVGGEDWGGTRERRRSTLVSERA